MLKLLLVAVAGLALVNSQANVATHKDISTELGPQYLVLKAGEEQRYPVEPSTRSVIISNRIKNLLEGYKEDLRNGNDRHGVLDIYTADKLGPYTIIGTPLNALGRIRVDFEDLLISGISYYDIESLNFSLLRMNLNADLRIPRVILHTNYNVNFRALLIYQHTLSGPFSFQARGVGVKVHTQLRVASGGSLQASTFDLELSMDSAHMSVSEVTGNVWADFFLDAIMQIASSIVLQHSMESISKAASELVFDVVNEALSQFTLADLLG